jgi:acyl-coenzyme A thioesterase PaaI-like protein
VTQAATPASINKKSAIIPTMPDPPDKIPRHGDRVTFTEDHCFVCGKKNPIGLHLTFDFDRDNHRATSEVVFKPEHQGWDRVVHGGILASVLDDVMAYALMTLDRMGITTRMNIAYRKAVNVGDTLYLEGPVEEIKSRIAKVKAVGYTMKDNNRVVRVEAKGTYFLDKPKGVDEHE